MVFLKIIIHNASDQHTNLWETRNWVVPLLELESGRDHIPKRSLGLYGLMCTATSAETPVGVPRYLRPSFSVGSIQPALCCYICVSGCQVPPCLWHSWLSFRIATSASPSAAICELSASDRGLGAHAQMPALHGLPLTFLTGLSSNFYYYEISNRKLVQNNKSEHKLLTKDRSRRALCD